MDLGILPLDCLETFDYSQKLHAVVGRETESLRHLLLIAAAPEHHPVSSRARVAARSAVCVKVDRRFLL